jgi:FkbM family methyltransferase
VIVTRGGCTFDVVDDPQSSSWGFWGKFEDGSWEPETLAAFDRLLDPSMSMLDVGSWIGPTVLWAARLAGSVVAVEPDGVARQVLTENVARNCPNVEIVASALAAERGEVLLGRQGAWGNSMSTTRGGEDGVIVPALPLAALVPDGCGLIKIDVEGAEATLIGDGFALLHELGVPVVLSLHGPWVTPHEQSELAREISDFTVETLDTTDPAFPTLLLLP